MPGTMEVWAEPFTTLRLQKIFNLLQDPYERADITSNTFWDWQLNHMDRVRHDGRGLQVRGDIQGLSAAVPAEIQPGEHHGRHAPLYQSTGKGREGIPDAPQGNGVGGMRVTAAVFGSVLSAWFDC